MIITGKLPHAVSHLNAVVRSAASAALPIHCPDPPSSGHHYLLSNDTDAVASLAGCVLCGSAPTALQHNSPPVDTLLVCCDNRADSVAAGEHVPVCAARSACRACSFCALRGLPSRRRREGIKGTCRVFQTCGGRGDEQSGCWRARMTSRNPHTGMACLLCESSCAASSGCEKGTPCGRRGR